MSYLSENYHLIAVTGRAKDSFKPRWARGVFSLLNTHKFEDYENVAQQVLQPELERLGRSNEDVLTIFHVRWAGLGRSSLGSQDLAGAQAGDDGQVDPEYQKFLELVRRDNYRYPPRYEAYVNAMRERYRLILDEMGRRLHDYMERSSTELTSEWEYLVTSDHGTALGGGRLWYAYHASEDVIRVPLLYFGKNDWAADKGVYSTPDIHASVLDYFGLEYDRARTRSVFRVEDPPHDWVASLCRAAHRLKERPLVLRGKAWKFVANVHPQGDAAWAYSEVRGWTETLRSADSTMKRMAEPIQEALRRFGVEKFRSPHFEQAPSSI